MIRCKLDIISFNEEKKRSEAPTTPAKRVAAVLPEAGPFAALFAGEAHRWASTHNISALRRLAGEARVKLCGSEYSRFVSFVEGRHGTAVARQAGLPVGRPQLTVAS